MGHVFSHIIQTTGIASLVSYLCAITMTYFAVCSYVEALFTDLAQKHQKNDDEFMMKSIISPQKKLESTIKLRENFIELIELHNTVLKWVFLFPNRFSSICLCHNSCLFLNFTVLWIIFAKCWMALYSRCLWLASLGFAQVFFSSNRAGILCSSKTWAKSVWLFRVCTHIARTDQPLHSAAANSRVPFTARIGISTQLNCNLFLRWWCVALKNHSILLDTNLDNAQWKISQR